MTRGTRKNQVGLSGNLTKMLAAAVAKASAVDPGEQDALASLMDEEMKSEKRWKRAFARSGKKPAAMADEALAEHRRGETRPLDLRDLDVPRKRRRGGELDPLDREIDFRGGVRGKYYKRAMEGTNVVLLDRDVAAEFRTSKAVNAALRELLKSKPRRSRPKR